MLSGKTPFGDAPPTQVLHELYMKEKPIELHVPPTVPEPVQELLHAMLEKDKEKRIANATILV